MWFRLPLALLIILDVYHHVLIGLTGLTLFHFLLCWFEGGYCVALLLRNVSTSLLRDSEALGHLHFGALFVRYLKMGVGDRVGEG